MSLTRLTVVLFLINFLIYAISPQSKLSFSDLTHGAEVTRVALNLAQEGDFAHPYYAMPTGYTAHTAPAYVFLYALIAKVFGIGALGARILWTLNVAFVALQLALLPALSQTLGLGVGSGVVASFLGIMIQPYRILPEWESLFVGALLVSLCVMTLSYLQLPGNRQHAFLLGFLWGVGILANPESILLLFAWPGVACCCPAKPNTPPGRRTALLRTIPVIFAGAALVMLPWFIRNYQRFGAVFFVRDNFGLELYTSNNPCALPTVLENVASGCHYKTHPNANPEIAGNLLDKGEVPFNRERLHDAIAWIAANPRAFGRLTARRFAKFWFPYLGGLRYAIPMGILTVLALGGLLIMYRENKFACLTLGSALFIYPVIHYIIQFEARYRYPIFWATLLPSAYFLLTIGRLRRRKGERAPLNQARDRELVRSSA